jgi:hypothetical protein
MVLQREQLPGSYHHRQGNHRLARVRGGWV